MSTATPELMWWLTGLRQEVKRTNTGFATLNPIGWPVPFFGDIRTARILTVGVNPSPDEFTHPRWADITNDSQWAHRLLNYFHVPSVPWHKWFQPWETALRLLGCSYENRTAVHLDLSPRATTVMRNIPEELRPDFCHMVAGDVRWLYGLLAFAPSARLILAAGGMIEPEPKKWLPVASCLEREAAQNGSQIERVGGGSRLVASGGSGSLPLHSFTSGPAAQDKFKLIEDVFAAHDQLLPLLRWRL